MHVLDEREATMAAAAITLYIAMRDALHLTHGDDEMPLEESAELMRLADRLSVAAAASGIERILREPRSEQ
jgi:hypothetical protein